MRATLPSKNQPLYNLDRSMLAHPIYALTFPSSVRYWQYLKDLINVQNISFSIKQIGFCPISKPLALGPRIWQFLKQPPCSPECPVQDKEIFKEVNHVQILLYGHKTPVLTPTLLS